MESFKARPRAWRFIILIALGLVFVVACDNNPPTTNSVSTDTPRGPQQPRTQPPLPPVSSAHTPGGAPASEAARANAQTWTMLDGRHVRASDYKGKVLVLDFWATYCPPCRDEVPHLVALQKRYEAQGLAVVGLNVGGDEDRPKVPGFVAQYRIQYPLGYPSDEMSSLVFAETDAIPQTYVFDRNGRLVERFRGFDPAVAEGLENAVKAALATQTN